MVRILLVDDDPLVRKTIALVLRNRGHVVLEASDGADAIAEMECTAIDLVITDIMMPGLDGIGLILAIKARCPALPVLCISGGGGDQKMQYLGFARKLGAHLVLAKPFTPKELQSAVEAALQLPDADSENCNDC